MFKTDQEQFWAGEFGDNYIERNRSDDLIASNIALFSRVFQRTQTINSVLELGANIGLNLKAIRHLLPKASLSAVEINTNAVAVLRNWLEAECKNGGGGNYTYINTRLDIR